MLTHIILTAQGNYALETFYISAIDMLRKSIIYSSIQLAITQNVEFGITVCCEFEIIITFEWNMQ